METVFRAIVVYAVVVVVMQLSGRRTLGQMTVFDFVLLLIISETTQQAMVDDDHSVTAMVVLVVTLVGLDVGMSLVKRRWPRVGKWVDGTSLVIVSRGVPDKALMHKARVDEDDVLGAARSTRGLERMNQIKYAVLEPSGEISIIPYDSSPDPAMASQERDPA